MTKTWRDVLAVHPAAELFPRMSEDELKELAADIKKNGLRHRVEVMRDGTGGFLALDGRNRLDALELAGVSILGAGGELARNIFHVLPRMTDDEAAAHVISANVRRRHLTSAQKRQLVAKVLKLKPEQSNLQIAKKTGVTDKTVAAVRAKAEARSEIPKVEVRRDSKGRKVPAKKAKPVSRGALIRPVKSKPSAEKPEPEVEPGEELEASAHRDEPAFEIVKRLWPTLSDAQRDEIKAMPIENDAAG